MLALGVTVGQRYEDPEPVAWTQLRRDLDALEFGGFEWAKRFLAQCYADSITPTEGARRLDRPHNTILRHTEALIKIAKSRGATNHDLGLHAEAITSEEYAEAKAAKRRVATWLPPLGVRTVLVTLRVSRHTPGCGAVYEYSDGTRHEHRQREVGCGI